MTQASSLAFLSGCQERLKVLLCSKRLSICFSFFTYCLIVAWLYTAGHGSAYVSGQGGISYPIQRYAFLIALIAALLFLAVFDRFLIRSKRKMLSWLFCCCFIAGTMVILLGGLQEALPIHMVATIGSILMGAGYAWCLLSFWEYLNYSVPIKAIGIILAIGIACAYIVYLVSEVVVSDIGGVAVLFVITVLLFLSTIYIDHQYAASQKHVYNKEDDCRQETNGGQQSLSGISRVRRLVNSKTVAILIANISMIPLKGMGTFGFWGYQRYSDAGVPDNYHLVFLGSLALFAALSIPTVCLAAQRMRKAGHNSMRIPLLLLIIATFIAIIARLPDFSATFSSVIYMVVGLYSQVLFCFATALYMKNTSLSAFRVCGIIYGGSFLIGTAWAFLFEDMPDVVKLILLLVAYSIMIYLIKKEPGTAQLTDAMRLSRLSTQNTGAGGNIELLVKQFKLTKREAEILCLLAQGRSVPYIEEVLVLSNGTVRTHVRHIYEKMSLHNKQELIDLVNSYIRV
jgi:DNA-binding CsgD family transcriptional regulator